ncbi:MAG: exo-alpha-sialidase, partial [Acidobacteriota bacterium]
RFESLGVDARGHIYLAWIDKRDRGPTRQRGEAYRGAAVYYAVSTDRGQTFAENLRVAPHACECCRIAMAPAPNGGVAVLWRHIFEPNVRDHAFAIVGPEGVESEMRRATFEGWKLDGCPHHGPSLAPTVDQVGYHATWFSAADGTARVFYGRFDAGGGLVADPIEVASGVPAAHPSLAVHGPRVHLVWKAVADGVTEVILQTSVDGGVNWLPPEPVLSTTGASDHPLLFSHAEHAVLSWRTDVEGLRIASLG